MSLFRTIDPADATAYEGQASLGAIADAARDVALYADNVNAELYARTEAFDDAIKAVRTATGIELENPQLKPSGDPYQGMYPKEDPFQEWERRIGEIQRQYPDMAGQLSSLNLEGVEKATRGKALEAGKRLDALSSTRGGSGIAASLAGGIRGAFRDPVTLMTLPLGLGGGAGRTVGAKILSTAWREALVSGATEAAFQPVVQKWRGEAGLPSGLKEGAKNIAAATLLGGAFGAAARGAYELPGSVRRQMARRADPRLKAPAAEQIADDLRPLRDQLPPEARAAVDLVDQDVAIRTAVRGEVGDDFGAELARTMDEAEQFAETAGTPQEPRYRPQPAPQRTERRPASLTEFLAREGLKDEGGELAAMDLDKAVIPGSGRLVRKNGGLPLDRAREAAAEAGYMHGFGSRADAVANSTVDDLLSALREEQAGRRVFALGDEDQVARWRQEQDALADYQRSEALRREIFYISGGRLSPDESARAFRLVEGGMDPDEAVERVFLYDDTSVLESGADPFEVGSTEFQEQLAGLENQIDPDDLLADLLFVDDSGKVVSSGRTVGEALQEADRGRFLSELVEACRPA